MKLDFGAGDPLETADTQMAWVVESASEATKQRRKVSAESSAGAQTPPGSG